MVDIILCSVVHPKTMIKDTIEFLEPDLHIITKEGTTIRTNKLLVGQASSLLRSLLIHTPSPSILFLPDVRASVVLHLIQVVKTGITEGRGSGYSVLKEVRELAQVLGFQNIPQLTFVVEGQSQHPQYQHLNQRVHRDADSFKENVVASTGFEEDEVGTDTAQAKIPVRMEIECNQKEVENGSSNVTGPDQSIDCPRTWISHDVLDEMLVKTEEDQDNLKTSAIQSHNRPFSTDTNQGVISNGIHLPQPSPSVSTLNNKSHQEKNQFKMKNSRSSSEQHVILTSVKETIETHSTNADNTNTSCIKQLEMSMEETLQDENSNEEPEQGSVLNLCHFEPLNYNSAQKREYHKIKSFKINNNNSEIEVYEFKSQEIADAIPKVLKKETNENNPSTEVIPKFACDNCGKTFSNAATLLVHAEKHGQTKGKRKCILCNFSGERTNLLTHIRSVHTKEKLFECSVCLKRFSTCGQKNNHEMRHAASHPEKMFECSVCMKKFFSLAKKETHENLHIDQPKEKCCVCHKTFSSVRAKNEHEKRHTT